MAPNTGNNAPTKWATKYARKFRDYVYTCGTAHVTTIKRTRVFFLSTFCTDTTFVLLFCYFYWFAKKDDFAIVLGCFI